MGYRVAINGFGRIGRDYLRCVLERGLFDEGIEVVAVNDVWDAATLAHLLQYDSAFGRLGHQVDTTDSGIVVNGWSAHLYQHRGPDALPWDYLNVDLVIEST